jgi:signal transduction histidine kinase
MTLFSSRIMFPSYSWLASFCLMLALLLTNGVISYHAIITLITNEDKVHKTLNTLNIIKDTFSAIQDAETGERGFLISGENSYLEPYDIATKRINVHLDQLLELEANLATQRPRIFTLIQLTQAKLQEMEKTIQLRKQHKEGAALKLFLTDEGNSLMRQIRSLVSELQQTAYDRLEQQRAEANQVQQQVIITQIFATVLGLILAGIIFVLVGRALKKQREDAEKLEALVADRTLALERYAVELQRSNRELQDFAFVASHDLQEPLRKIRSFGDRLEQKYAAQLGDGADYIRRMQVAAARMSRLIEDLLAFSRISSQAKKFEQVSLQEILEDVLEDLYVTIEAKGAQVNADPLPTIEADPTQMRQLLQNLVGNAIKFVPADRNPVINILTRIILPEENATDAGWFEMQIIDNGIGFDEKFIDRIFTPFQRLHGKDEYPGTGIGLSICRRIVEHHHGRIQASSIPGKSATFIVRLPLRQECAAQLYTSTGTHHALR